MARPQPQRKPHPGKILRIGVIQNGTIIEERLLRKRGEVTVGTSFKNTFCVSAPGIPTNFTLFDIKGGKYVLQFQKNMTGRISVGQGVHTLASLKEHGKAVNNGKCWTVPIDERSRGKVMVGDVIFLYQFVTPPPTTTPPQLPVALRGSFFSFLNNTVELTGLFGVALMLSLIVQVGFVTYLVLEVPPPPRPSGVSDLPDQLQMILMDQQEDVPLEIADGEQTEDSIDGLAESAVTEEEPEVVEPVETESNRNRDDTVEVVEQAPLDRDEQLRAARETVREEAFWGAIATSDSGVGDGMDAIFNISDRQVEHVMRRQQARGESGVAGGTSVLGRGDASNAETVSVEVGRGNTTARADNVESGDLGERVRVQARIRQSRTRTAGSGRIDQDYLNGELRRRVRDVQRCYERVLPDEPDLEGRVVLQFVINERGRVENSQLRENTVGDTVGDCILGRVRRWRFDAPEDGNVTVRKTYILSPAGN